MAFNEGDLVRLKTPVIEGPVTDIAYDKASKQLGYMVAWTDAAGDEHCRWFSEDELELIEAATEETEGNYIHESI